MAQLRGALARLAAAPGLSVVASSSVYETEPVGEVLDQRDFLNAVVWVETELEPMDLLAECKAIEHVMGRVGGPRHGPRPIDVDVLLVEDRVLRSERLTLPHPELCRRRFVMVPLLELDSGLMLPDGRSLQDCLAALPPGQRVSRVAALEAGTG